MGHDEVATVGHYRGNNYHHWRAAGGRDHRAYRRVYLTPFEQDLVYWMQVCIVLVLAVGVGCAWIVTVW
jgi:hypothetical protein